MWPPWRRSLPTAVPRPAARLRAWLQREGTDPRGGQEDAFRTEEKNWTENQKQRSVPAEGRPQALFCTCRENKWQLHFVHKNNNNNRTNTEEVCDSGHGSEALLDRQGPAAWVQQLMADRRRFTQAYVAVVTAWAPLLLALSTAIMTTGRQSYISSQGCHYIWFYCTVIHVPLTWVHKLEFDEWYSGQILNRIIGSIVQCCIRFFSRLTVLLSCPTFSNMDSIPESSQGLHTEFQYAMLEALFWFYSL